MKKILDSNLTTQSQTTGTTMTLRNRKNKINEKRFFVICQNHFKLRILIDKTRQTHLMYHNPHKKQLNRSEIDFKAKTPLLKIPAKLT
jgi:hypothetical protein